MLDIFRSDAFGVVALTDAINKIPFVPGRAGAVIDWRESGVATLSILIEEIAGVLRLVNPTPRGGPGTTADKMKRKMRSLAIPHYQIDDGINADEVQGVRAFGQQDQVQTVMGQVNERMSQHTQLGIDPTLEYQRLGAIKGIILNADGNTLYNLFTEFEVSQHTEVDFDFGQTSSGAVRAKCADVVRTMAKSLGGMPFSGVYALCANDFFDDLIKDPEVRATYLQQQEAQQLRAPYAYTTFNFGGITFEDYRGGTGDEESTPFIDSGKCHMFPIGVPGLFRTVYAPADYNETVNTLGLPRYARQWERDDGKGVNLQVQTNALNFCTRPRVLMKGHS